MGSADEEYASTFKKGVLEGPHILCSLKPISNASAVKCYEAMSKKSYIPKPRMVSKSHFIDPGSPFLKGKALIFVCFFGRVIGVGIIFAHIRETSFCFGFVCKNSGSLMHLM